MVLRSSRAGVVRPEGWARPLDSPTYGKSGKQLSLSFPEKAKKSTLASIACDIRRGPFAELVASLLPGCHQCSNMTALDRYPEIFAAAAAAADARRILSFGCSTGEECVTLRRYFPLAEIIGTDINPLNLWEARRRHRSDGIRFVYASDRALSSRGLFDAICCLTVLRDTRLDDEPSIRDVYPFERFNERVRFLHSLLRPAGLLVFYGNMYRFRDSSVAQDYEMIPLTHTPVGKNITFARSGRNDGAEYLDVLFRKRVVTTRSSADVVSLCAPFSRSTSARRPAS
jgi:SAM-dependent methyltransferase